MDYPLSSIRFTHLQAFLRCPHRFKLHYLDRHYYFPPSVAIHRGKSVHGVAQATHTSKLEHDVDLPLDYCQDLAAWLFRQSAEHEGIWVPKSEWAERKKMAAEAYDHAVILAGVYRKDVAPAIRPRLVEHTMTVDLGVDVPIEGTLDLVTVDEIIDDIKTTTKKYGEDEAHKSLQITNYNIMYKEKYGHFPRGSRLTVLIAKKESEAQVLETSRDETCIPAFKERLIYMIRMVQAGLFPPTEPTNWWCSEKWCNYWQVCRYAIKTS